MIHNQTPIHISTPAIVTYRAAKVRGGLTYSHMVKAAIEGDKDADADLKAALGKPGRGWALIDLDVDDHTQQRRVHSQFHTLAEAFNHLRLFHARGRVGVVLSSTVPHDREWVWGSVAHTWVFRDGAVERY